MCTIEYHRDEKKKQNSLIFHAKENLTKKLSMRHIIRNVRTCANFFLPILSKYLRAIMEIFINGRNNKEQRKQGKQASGCYMAGVICLIYACKVRDARQLAAPPSRTNLFQLDRPPVSVVVQCKQRGALPAVLFVQRRGFIRDIIATS